MKKTSESKAATAGTAVLCVLAALIAFYLSFDFFQPALTVPVFGFKNYIVLTQSMSPRLNRGDMIWLTRVNINALKPMDIIVFQPAGRDELVCHYLAERSISADHKLIMKTKRFGAGEDQWDYWQLDRSRIVGKVSWVMPSVGHIFLYLRSPQGLTGTAAVIVLALLYRKIMHTPCTDDPPAAEAE